MTGTVHQHSCLHMQRARGYGRARAPHSMRRVRQADARTMPPVPLRSSMMPRCCAALGACRQDTIGPLNRLGQEGFRTLCTHVLCLTPTRSPSLMETRSLQHEIADAYLTRPLDAVGPQLLCLHRMGSIRWVRSAGAAAAACTSSMTQHTTAAKRTSIKAALAMCCFSHHEGALEPVPLEHVVAAGRVAGAALLLQLLELVTEGLTVRVPCVNHARAEHQPARHG